MPSEENPFSDPPARSTPRVGRSQTSQDVSTKPAAAPANKRAVSQDSVDPVTVEPRSRSGKAKKKSSQHADVIDRLDFTGVGPSAYRHL